MYIEKKLKYQGYLIKVINCILKKIEIFPNTAKPQTN